MSAQQLQQREIIVLNTTENTISVRAAFHQIAVTQQDVTQCSSKFKSNANSKGIGAGVQFGIAGVPLEVGLNAKYNKSDKIISRDTHFNEERLQMQQQSYTQPGWNEIPPSKQKTFTVQGPISYISVIDVTTRETRTDNWNTSKTEFTYFYDNGYHFESIDYGIGDTEHTPFVPEGNDNKSNNYKDENKSNNDEDEKESSDPSCHVIFLVFYHTFGLGILGVILSFIFIAVKNLIFILLAPCHLKTTFLNGFMMVKCSLVPTLIKKYKKKKSDNTDNCAACMCWTQLWWFLLTLPTAVLHYGLAISTVVTVVGYPFAKVHLELANFQFLSFLYIFKFNFES